MTSETRTTKTVRPIQIRGTDNDEEDGRNIRGSPRRLESLENLAEIILVRTRRRIERPSGHERGASTQLCENSLVRGRKLEREAPQERILSQNNYQPPPTSQPRNDKLHERFDEPAEGLHDSYAPFVMEEEWLNE
ncbi:hypothetical protein O181_050267 [Austropuccinia psidii MF-1]|uniref:Uncharacterized protein n=1 Tax=Austropuccinia psidii MF-1 TaxID=1389203 RepID=A0A9Q3HNF2_9BASI|nr:hypothetical protein [Austropuccinia psidii MF-1]